MRVMIPSIILLMLIGTSQLFLRIFGPDSGLEEHQVALCLQLRRILLAATGYLVVTLCRQKSVVCIFSSLSSGLAPQSWF